MYLLCRTGQNVTSWKLTITPTMKIQIHPWKSAANSKTFILITTKRTSHRTLLWCRIYFKNIVIPTKRIFFINIFDSIQSFNPFLRPFYSQQRVQWYGPDIYCALFCIAVQWKSNLVRLLGNWASHLKFYPIHVYWRFAANDKFALFDK